MQPECLDTLPFREVTKCGKLKVWGLVWPHGSEALFGWPQDADLVGVSTWDPVCLSSLI